MGKKLLLLAAAMLILPSAAKADSTVAFFYTGGTLVGTDSGLSLSGAAITTVTGFNGSPINGADLGTVNFTTGPLQFGSLGGGGVFLPGGTFTIVGGGSNGIPAGVLFSGTFDQRNGWTPYTLPDGSHHLVLHGSLEGTWLGSQTVSHVPMELTVDTQGASFSSDGQMVRGSILLPVSVPEPSTLACLCMGTLGLAGALFQRFRA